MANAISLQEGSPALYALVADTTSEGHAWLPATMPDGRYRPPIVAASPPPSPCVDTEVKPKKCKKKQCKKQYDAAKLQKCKKTCGLCEPLPPSAPPSPPPPPALPEVDCSGLTDNKKKCKIKVTKCKKKPPNSMTKCGKKCKKDRKKKKLCQRTCCKLNFPV